MLQLNSTKHFFDTFYQLTLDEKEISHYNKIREFLSESDLNTLLEEFDWDKAFAVRILEVENVTKASGKL